MCSYDDLGPGGLGFAPVRGTEKNERGTSQRPGDVGGAGIGAEDGLGAVEHGDEGAEAGLAAEVDEAAGGIEREPGPLPEDDELVVGHGVDELLVIAPRPELGAPAGIGMERDVGAEVLEGVGERSTGGELEVEGLDGDVEVLEAGEVALGGGDGGVGDVFVIERAGAFAGGFQADAAGAAGGPGHQGAAEEALEVDGDVVLFVAELAAPAPDFGEAHGRGPAFAGVKDGLAQAGMALEDFGEGVVDDPVDLGGRPAALESGEDGQRLDDVAERAGFDDQNLQGLNLDGITELTEGEGFAQRGRQAEF